MATTPAARPSPERIFNTLNAYQQSEALKTGIELDLFTAIGEGIAEPAALAKEVHAAERGVRILCDYLAIHGFLHKSNGRYTLSPDAAVFLSKKSPAYIGSAIGFLMDADQVKKFSGLTEAVRKGGTAFETGDHTKPHEEMWVKFAKSIGPLAMPNANFVAQVIDARSEKPMKVLDIAAGHGMYGITIARQNPHARIVAVDWPAVLQVAKENARTSGIADRYETRPGSAFEGDLGEGYDYVLLTNILHHFDETTCEELLRRAHAALKPGGSAVTVEFVPNADRISPPTAAAFPLIMLANTDSGDAYTFAEYETMFKNAGFHSPKLHSAPDLPEQLVVAEK
jgi:2-polyprenyl-3-methyl-5-hydroxy-6-metoxy-1,4-benzoquinol methylase